jgi:dCMP deaminase
MYLYESNEKTLRWDTYFYDLCQTVAKNSQCLSRHIGAVLVKDKTVLCAGYNGPPRGVQQCDKRWFDDKAMRDHAGFGDTIDEKQYENELMGVCPRYVKEMGFASGQGLDWCVAGHAERNALINAARMGIKTKGCHLFMDCGTPCTPCLVEIINAGIKEIIITGMNLYDKSSLYVLKQSGLKVRIYSTLCEHENLLEKNGLAFANMKGYCSDCGMQIGDV